MKNLSLFLPLAFLFLLSSCGMMDDLRIEKRRYNKGFYVHKRDNRSAEPVAQPGAAPENIVLQQHPVSSIPGPDGNPVPAGGGAAPQYLPPPAAGQQHTVTIDPSSFAPGKTTAAKDNPAKAPKPENHFAKKTKSVLKASKGPAPQQPAADLELVLLVIIALLLPPLAVWVKEKTTNRFWIDLICWILGFGGVFFFFWSGALMLFAILFALLIVLDVI